MRGSGWPGGGGGAPDGEDGCGCCCLDWSVRAWTSARACSALSLACSASFLARSRNPTAGTVLRPKGDRIRAYCEERTRAAFQIARMSVDVATSPNDRSYLRRLASWLSLSPSATQSLTITP